MATRALEHPVRAIGKRQKCKVVPSADLLGAVRHIASAALCWVVTRDVPSGSFSLTQRNAAITGIFGWSRCFVGVRLVCGGDMVVSRVVGRVLDYPLIDAGTAVAATAGVSP